ncbi:MAG: hypothetical protein AAF401_11295 [Pseudomonadota bacterium]
MPTIQVIKFHTEYDHAPGTVETRGVDWVLIASIGDLSTQTWHRVSSLKPKEGMQAEGNVRMADALALQKARWAEIEPVYTSWKSNGEIPVDGTPLAAWAGVTTGLARHLTGMGIKTVESLSELSEDRASSLPFPDARRLPGMAKSFLESRDAASKDAELADLKSQLAALQEQVEGKTSEGEDPAPKPRRGRPPKKPEEGERDAA